MIQPASAAEIGTRWSRSARKGRKVAKIAKNQKNLGQCSTKRLIKIYFQAEIGVPHSEIQVELD